MKRVKLFQFLLVFILILGSACTSHRLSSERIVFQTKFGDIEMALWPDVAPITAAHIMKLAKMGSYNTVDFFRVDKGFVAQCRDIFGNRKVPLSPLQEEEAKKQVPLEVRKDAPHDRRGILSMARWTDPNSGSSSFSITLGAAPHLDMQYATFGEVTGGMATLDAFEAQPTRTEGIFVMPKEPITIESSYVISPSKQPDSTGDSCPTKLRELQFRFESQAAELLRIRSKELPGS